MEEIELKTLRNHVSEIKNTIVRHCFMYVLSEYIETEVNYNDTVNKLISDFKFNKLLTVKPRNKQHSFNKSVSYFYKEDTDWYLKIETRFTNEKLLMLKTIPVGDNFYDSLIKNLYLQMTDEACEKTLNKFNWSKTDLELFKEKFANELDKFNFKENDATFSYLKTTYDENESRHISKTSLWSFNKKDESLNNLIQEYKLAGQVLSTHYYFLDENRYVRPLDISFLLTV